MDNCKFLLSFIKKNKHMYIVASLFTLFGVVFTTLEPYVLKNIVDTATGKESIVAILNDFSLSKSELIIWLCCLILIFAGLSSIFNYLKGSVAAKATENVAKNIRVKLFEKIIHAKVSEFRKEKTGDIVQRCTSDIDTISEFLSQNMVEFIRIIVMVTFASVGMFLLNQKLALVGITCVPFLLTLSILFFQKVTKVFKKVEEAEGQVTGDISEYLNCVNVVKAFTMQSEEVKKFDISNKKYHIEINRLIKWFAFFWVFANFLGYIQFFAVVMYGTHMVINNEITVGTISAFLGYLYMIVYPTQFLGRILSDFGKALVATGRVKKVIEFESEEVSTNDCKNGITGEIEFKNVNFSYDGKENAISNLNFKIEKGKRVAIVGHTGSGKTTIVNLLGRLFDNYDGSIKIDGMELKDINRNYLRDQIGIVTQETFLFSKTIKSNIRIRGKKICDENIKEVTNIAHIHNSIEEFEKGYKTLLGEKGVNLSGGQKQRISIARTILGQYPVLIFDDSLSAVDTETESRIKHQLRKKLGNVTVITISHRQSSVMDADEILVMDKGHIVERGTHKELIKINGVYANLFKKAV